MQMTVQNTMSALRRERLRTWINSKCEGSQAKFVEITDINQGELSLLLRDKAFGEKKARSLERLAGMPEFYLDTPPDQTKKSKAFDFPPDSYPVSKIKLNAVPVVGRGMGGLPDTLFSDEGRVVNGHDEYAEVYSSDVNAFVTRVEGNSMFPKYEHGEYALVEPNTNADLGDDVILKTITGQVMIKRLMARRNGSVHLTSYNETQTHTFMESELLWIYYVAYPVPSKKIKART